MLTKLKKFISEYNDVYKKVWSTGDFKHPLSTFIRNDIAQDFMDLPFIDTNKYLVKASCGTGKWTSVPWIAVFDRRITTSAQKGVYVVYLINKDTQELFLTLNQAASGSNITELAQNARIIRSVLNIDSCEPIKTGASTYDAGCIYSKKYTLQSLNDFKSFESDLKYFLDLYEQYYLATMSAWWPSLDEYDPGISTEKWLELLNSPDILGENIRRMLAGMYTQGGSATCAQLAELYGKTASHYVMTAVHAAENVVKATNCPILQDKEDSKYWPVFFVGRSEPKTDRFIWKIRDELYAALTEYGIEKHLPQGPVTGKFDSWEIVDDNTAIKHCDKSFFEYRGSGVPKGICWFFGADDMELGETKTVKLIYNGMQYQGSIKNESSDRRRVRIFWSTELGNLLNAYNVPDAAATFKKIANETYEVSIKGGEKEMTIKEKVAAIKDYIAAKGFNYEGNLIENFYLSLKSKPFVILAGTSGTGKTKLVEYFAEAIGAQIQLVPVRPDWSDSSDLFGHKDLSGNFHPGAIIDFLKAATENPAIPHFLCLDEMNLARVEYYMSDLLSIIETRKFNEQHTIVTKPLIGKDYCRCTNGRNDYGEMGIPENLYIIGTVNMDETTFPFSKKVLDRANTIEFSFVDLTRRVAPGETVAPQNLDNSFLRSNYLHLIDCDDTDLIDDICFDLNALNQILLKANLHVGYRVRDEISFYMMNNKKAELLDEDAAFDHEIMQKILPRVQGSSAAIKDVLSELFSKCAGDYTGFAGAAAYEQMNAYLDSKSCKYPNSAKKIAFMMRRYEEDGFTSYWL